MMQVFVYEYLSGGGLVDGDAEHIEGNSDKIKGLVLKTCFLRKA